MNVFIPLQKKFMTDFISRSIDATGESVYTMVYVVGRNTDNNTYIRDLRFHKRTFDAGELVCVGRYDPIKKEFLPNNEMASLLVDWHDSIQAQDPMPSTAEHFFQSLRKYQ